MLLRAREMNIESKMLIVTEIPRTLQWVIRKTMDFGKDLEKRKLNKMARLLMKEWKIKLGIK